MVSYKYYEDADFDISDGAVIIDLDTDVGGRQPIWISCDEGTLLLEFEFNVNEDFGDQGTLTSCDDVMSVLNVRRLRINAAEDNTSYRIWGGLR